MSALSEDSFAGFMVAVGPFETRPALAVAVSGGADSLALCLLADIWVRRRQGRLIALTVDHGLRTESSREAARVGLWLAARGIEHHVLAWDGDKPKARIQEVAREARYAILTAWCREHGVLHLALGHQEEDQAETFLMRLARGSGEDGLAAISAIVETAGVRLIRPLLGVSRAGISETLRAFDQEWIEDPSNRNRAFERVRVRSWLPPLTEAGCAPGRIAAWAADFGRRRIRAEIGTAKLLAATCRVYPAGYAELASAPWANAPDDLAVRALGRVTTAIGGGGVMPRAGIRSNRCSVGCARDSRLLRQRSADAGSCANGRPSSFAGSPAGCRPRPRSCPGCGRFGTTDSDLSSTKT